MYNSHHLFPCNTKINIFHISSACSTVKKKKIKRNFCLCPYESWSRISCLILFILTSGVPCSIFYCYSAVFCALVAACINLSGKIDFPTVLRFLSSTSFPTFVVSIDSITISNKQKRRLGQKDLPSLSINFLSLASCNFSKRLRVTFTFRK